MEVEKTEPEVSKYIRRKYFKIIQKPAKEHFMFKNITTLYVALDPNKLEIVNTFKGARDLNFATGTKGMKLKLNRYFKED